VGVHFGPIGMAAAWVVATPLLVLVSSSLSLPVIGLSWRRLGGAIWPPLTAALGMGLAVGGVDRLLPAMAPLPRLAILVPAGVAAYAALVMLVARPLVVQALAMVRGRSRPATA
jgi:hypothetical protein